MPDRGGVSSPEDLGVGVVETLPTHELQHVEAYVCIRTVGGLGATRRDVVQVRSAKGSDQEIKEQIAIRIGIGYCGVPLLTASRS